MIPVVQFTTLADFLADLNDGKVAGIYYALIEHRVSRSKEYDLSRWRAVTIVRALVVNHIWINGGQAIQRIATLAIPHGGAIDRLNGLPMFRGEDDESAWHANLRFEHNQVVDYVRERLANYGLMNLLRAGILDIPADTSLLHAANPLDELVDELTGDKQ